MNHALKIWMLTAVALLFTTIQAHAQLTTLPQDVDYSAWMSSLIYSNNFSTDPTQPTTSNTEDSAKLEAFFITNKSCISSQEELSYRLLVRNTGESPAKDLFISVQISPHASIVSQQRPANEQNDHLKTLAWQEPSLTPNRSILYTFTVKPNEEITPFLHEGVVDYLAGNTVQRSITSHVIEEKCSPKDS